MNIGITISKTQTEKIWANGVVQNILNLYFLLKNIHEFNVFLVDSNVDKTKEIEEGVYLNELDEIIDDLNVLIVAGYIIPADKIDKLKKNGCKIIYYSCGSEYFFDMEIVLFNKQGIDKLFAGFADEIWIIPQNYETNKFYFETLYKKPTKSIPFIWSPFFINKMIKTDIDNIEFFYKPNNTKKRISIFEPNMDIVKYALYPILICEMLYEENKKLIDNLYVTNSDKIKTNELFIDIMRHLNIVKDGVATFESRFNTPYFLGKYTDVVVSHQMYNPLNYAYLDALYLKYPLVHNAYMIKDAGYYYDGFNAEIGKEKLKYALTEHDNNMEEYEEKSRKVLERYLPTNEESLKIYKKVILDLFK